MNREEQYVRAATRGLTATARHHIQNELRDHITGRARQLMLGGLSAEQARAQAMQELGPASMVARSLRASQHVHPAYSAVALLGLAAALLWPVPDLVIGQSMLDTGTTTSSVQQLRQQGYLTPGEVNAELHAHGIDLKHRDGQWLLIHVGLPDAPLGVSGFSCDRPMVSDASDQPRLWPSGTPRTAYVNPSGLLSCLSEAGWPLTVQGEQVSLYGRPFPRSWSAGQLPNLYERTLRRSLGGLPRHLWAAPHFIEGGVGGPLVWPWAMSAPAPTRTVTLLTPADHVILLIRSTATREQLQPTRQTYTSPIFLAVVLPVGAGGQVDVPVRLTRPGREEAPITLTSSLIGWQQAALETQPAMVLALPANTAGAFSLTPLPVHRRSQNVQ